RRADRRARRLGAGCGAEPAAAAQGVARHELPVRVARPQRGAPAVRPRHRHEGRPDRRAGTDRARARRARGAVHARPAGRDSASEFRRKPSRPDRGGAVMPGAARDPLDEFIAAGAIVLDLTIEPEWLPAVRAHLEITLRQATLVAEFALPDD